MSTMLPKNLEGARRAKLRPLNEIAAEIGIGEHLLEPYGEGVAKMKLDAIEELSGRPRAKYVVVSAITPTPLGEGRRPPPSGWGRPSSTSARRRRWRCARPRWDPSSASRAAQRGAATARWCRWRRSTCTSPAILRAATGPTPGR